MRAVRDLNWHQPAFGGSRHGGVECASAERRPSTAACDFAFDNYATVVVLVERALVDPAWLVAVTTISSRYPRSLLEIW